MKRETIIILFTVFFLTACGYVLLFAEESQAKNTSLGTESQSTPATTESQPAPPTLTQPQEMPPVTEPEMQWLWGEVVSVDTGAKQMTVKYLDYETDTEKEISINVDDKTTYENAKSLTEIKAQDTLSLDYVVIDGKNIAKNISIETNATTSAEPGETKEETKPTPGLE